MSTRHSSVEETETQIHRIPFEEVDTDLNRSSFDSSSDSDVEKTEIPIQQRHKLPVQTINHRKDFVREWQSILSNRLAISFPVEFATDRSPAKWLNKINTEGHKWPKRVERCTQFTRGRIFIVEMPSPEHSAAGSFISQMVERHCFALPLHLGPVVCPEETQKWLMRTNGTHPTPDLLVSPVESSSQVPSFILEVGVSEGKDSLEDDAGLYLANGVKCVLLLYIPDSKKKVNFKVNHPARTTIKYDMFYRLQTSNNGAIQDSGWIPFGNRAIGVRRRRPCTAAGQVILDIPTAGFFDHAPGIAPNQPHWTQLPANLSIDCWDLQQYIIERVKRNSGYV